MNAEMNAENVGEREMSELIDMCERPSESMGYSSNHSDIRMNFRYDYMQLSWEKRPIMATDLVFDYLDSSEKCLKTTRLENDLFLDNEDMEESDIDMKHVLVKKALDYYVDFRLIEDLAALFDERDYGEDYDE